MPPKHTAEAAEGHVYAYFDAPNGAFGNYCRFCFKEGEPPSAAILKQMTGATRGPS